jgi:predicted acylesterase/phospholipase RssA
MKKYNTLILSGGGVRGFGLLGSLQYLMLNKYLDNVHKFIGVSIGAILSVIIIVGYEPTEIIIKFIQCNYFKQFGSYSIIQALKGNGFLSFDDFKKILEELILEKVDHIPTLEELHSLFGKEFICLTFNYTLRKEVVLSRKTHPDLSILDALRMTSNVPFIFDPFVYEENVYFDGFLSNNFPLNLILEDDVCIAISCVKTEWKDDSQNLETWKLIWNLLLLPLYQLQDIKNKPYRKQCDIIELNLSQYTMLDYKLKPKVMLDMFSEGYCKVNEYFQQNENIANESESSS